MTDLIQQRKQLADRAMYTYNPDAFPGSKAWRINQQAEQALADFDAANPAVKESIAIAKPVLTDSQIWG